MQRRNQGGGLLLSLSSRGPGRFPVAALDGRAENVLARRRVNDQRVGSASSSRNKRSQCAPRRLLPD